MTLVHCAASIGRQVSQLTVGKKRMILNQYLKVLLLGAIVQPIEMIADERLQCRMADGQ